MEAIEDLATFIPSAARDLAEAWVELGQARSLATLGMRKLPG
jgi:hypothetical protein